MGRRSRQREAAAAATRPAARSTAPAPPPPPSTPRRRARVEEAPKAPWHPVPLVEIAVLVGIVAMAIGFFSEGARRETLVTAGVALASLAGLEVSIREHFAGFRSHTALLALTAALLVGVPLGLATDERLVGLGAGILAGVAAFPALRAAFTRRAGGLSWRA
jgi:hypothetical protein